MELVEYQHGDIKGIKVSENTYKIKAEKSGIIKKIDALEVGKLSLNLGSGKVSIKDKIDYTVGVKLNFEVGDVVDKGDVLATIYYNKKNPEVLVDKFFKID